MTLLFPIGFLDLNLIDILDILTITFILYQVYKLVKGSVAYTILLGAFAIYTLYLIVKASGMELIGAILDEFMTAGVIAALILFQQEIRKFLLFIGKTNLFQSNNFFKSLWGGTFQQADYNIDGIVEAVISMSKAQPEPVGALLVFERGTQMDFYADSGDAIDAIISKRLLLSIFDKHTPLHDGAAIIGKDGRLMAARCILPVSENQEIPASMGLRHRAAIGLTEVSDALVLVVSEETGLISIIQNAKFQRGFTESELKERLIYHLLTGKEEDKETEENKAEEKEDEKKEVEKNLTKEKDNKDISHEEQKLPSG